MDSTTILILALVSWFQLHFTFLRAEEEEEEELEEETDDESTEDEEEEDSESDEDALDGAMPTPKRCKVAQARALKASLDSGQIYGWCRQNRPV